MPDFFSPPEVVAVMGLCDTFNRWANANQPPRGHEHYHPSAFGRCLRKMQYERYEERGLVEAEPEDPEPNMIRIWGNGHGMHDRWRDYFEGLGVLRGYWKCTNPFCGFADDSGEIDTSLNLKTFYDDPGFWLRKRRVHGKDHLQGVFKPETCICGWTKFEYDELDVTSEELNFRGHADAILDFSKFDSSKFMSVKQSYMIEYLPQRPVVVDMKSCNHFDFQNVAQGKPHDYYLTQLTIYANILDCDFGILLYENKNTQKTCAFHIPKNADTVFAAVQRQAKAMNEMVEVVDEDGNLLNLLPPPRPLSKDDKECTYCKFREICHASNIWDDPELPQLRSEFYGVGNEVVTFTGNQFQAPRESGLRTDQHIL